MSKPNHLVEYLYVDEIRLNSYFEQISEPIAYDKVPIWKAVIGLTSLKTEATQSRPGRPFTRHEKYLKLISYLENNNLLKKEPNDFFSEPGPHFVSSNRMVRKIIIPAKSHTNRISDLNIWVYSIVEKEYNKDNTSPFILFLIEDFKCHDDNTFGGYSAHSSLLLMLKDVFEREGHITPIFYTPGNDNLSEDLLKRFNRDPVGAFSALGAKIGPLRNVHSLYRVRAITGSDRNHAIVIGYPIVIIGTQI